MKKAITIFKYLIVIIFCSSAANVIGQNTTNVSQGKLQEIDFKNLRKYTVAIGTVVKYSENINGKLTAKRKFVLIGSGLMTYTRIKDTNEVITVVTAGHVIKYFRDNKADIYIRPSWADSITTTDYFGIGIPVLNPSGEPNTFLHPDSKIDLGCLIIANNYLNKEYIEYTEKNHIQIFPINNMTTPYLGNQVWIFGYPGHIESQLSNYVLCTIKSGYVAWKPEASMNNPDLKHISLVESNASFGNSGGPVFEIQDKAELIGILTGGYPEQSSVYINGKPVIDTISKQGVVAQGRSGVSIIEKAEYVRQLITYVRNEIMRIYPNIH